MDNLSVNSPEDVLDVLARVVAVLLRKHRVSEDEIQDFVSQIKERHMSDWFANFRATVNVQEERKKGQEIGEKVKLIKLVCGKIALGQNVDQIATDLLEDKEHIQTIYDIALGYAPDYDVYKIYEDLSESKSLVEK